MPTQCSPSLFEFARVEGRDVTASFDAGAMTSDAGALLLGATNRVLGLTRRLAACFKDNRNPVFTEHAVETLVMQRIVGIALGHEDLSDHDDLRHDPVMAVLAGKLAASRADCAPLARISHTTLRLKRIGRQFVTICDNDAEPRRMRLFSVAVSHHRRAGGVGVEHGGSAVSAS
jgi:hypothetical protein